MGQDPIAGGQMPEDVRVEQRDEQSRQRGEGRQGEEKDQPVLPFLGRAQIRYDTEI